MTDVVCSSFDCLHVAVIELHLVLHDSTRPRLATEKPRSRLRSDSCGFY